VLNFGRGFFGASPLVFGVLVSSGFAMIGAGLFYPFKKAKVGVLTGAFIALVVLVLIATDFLTKLLPL
jgi:hypothetical protein